jgi:hypothetical protein
MYNIADLKQRLFQLEFLCCIKVSAWGGVVVKSLRY